MRKAVLVLVLLVMLATAQPVRSETLKEITDNSAQFDGTQVSVSGEVIGVLMRGDKAWVNILEQGYSLGVWCDSEDARGISYIGNYTNQGDRVEVEGTYHLACLEHGGDTDLHAVSFRIASQGHPVERAPNLLLVLLSLVVLALAIFVFYYLRRQREEKKKIFPWPFY